MYVSGDRSICPGISDVTLFSINSVFGVDGILFMIVCIDESICLLVGFSVEDSMVISMELWVLLIIV